MTLLDLFYEIGMSEDGDDRIYATTSNEIITDITEKILNYSVMDITAKNDKLVITLDPNEF